MTITCSNCGSERFLAGEIELDPDGGFVLVMPCAVCKHPNPTIVDHDPEFAQMLLEFFGAHKEGA